MSYEINGVVMMKFPQERLFGTYLTLQDASIQMKALVFMHYQVRLEETDGQYKLFARKAV